MVSKSIDEKITDLFYELLESYDKVVEVGRGYIKFKGNVLLHWDTDPVYYGNEQLTFGNIDRLLGYWFRNEDKSSTYKFYINMRNGLKYEVPKIEDRIEYAKVLNSLDSLLKNFEKDLIEEKLKFFGEDSHFADEEL